MAIDRANVGYNPAAELVRVTASPNLQDTIVRNDVNDSKSYQLAKQLGANFDGLNNLQRVAKANVIESAQNTASSMSTDELAAKIKSGELHSTISPVYNAVLKNTHYANVASNLQRETLTKITTGELNFSDDADTAKIDPATGQPNLKWQSGNQKLESYLLEQRNNALGEADAYGIAGFDTHWNKFKKYAIDKNFETLANKQVEFGISTASEAVRIAIAGDQTPDQLSNNFLAAYKKATLPSGALLNDEARKKVLEGAAFEIAKSGNVANLNALFNTKLDSGLTVRMVLNGKDGGKSTAGMEYTANTIAASNANRAQVDYFKNLSEQSVAKNNSTIAELVAQNRAFEVPVNMDKINPDGTQGLQPTTNAVYSALSEKTKGMSLAGRIETFNLNGVEDKETKNVIQAGLNNLNSITYNDQGKPAGELNANFQKSFDAYLVAKAVDPAYATKLAGSEGSKTLEDVELLKQTMGMDLNGAALIVAQARNNPTYINGNDKIVKATDKVVSDLNPSWFGRLFGADEITGNISNIRADVKRSAEVMIAAGASVETTMNSLGEYVQKNVVNVNGSLVYLRSVPATKDTPQIIGGSVTQIKRLISEVGTEVAVSQKFSPDEVQMSVSKDGNNFTFMAKNQLITKPNGMPLVLTKDQVTDWMNRDFENYKFDKTLEPKRKELDMALNDTYMGGRALKLTPVDQYLASPSGYRKLYQAGLETKPINELRTWAKEQIKQGSSWATPATPVKDYSAAPKPEPDLGYGKREDGTQKGKGYFGELITPDGKKMTEYSIGMEINGKEVLMPSLVPTLTKAEVDHIVKGKPLTDAIMDKAVAHAKKRIAEGKSPFYGQADEKSGGK